MPESSSSRSSSLTRRSFTVGAAVAAAAALVSAAPAAPAQAKPDAMARLSPDARAEAEAKVSEILRKYGSRLTEEQKADVRKVIAETQDGLEKMREFALTNGDQPATVLGLYEGSVAR